MASPEEAGMPQNEDPAFITDSIGTALSFLQTYGWFLVVAALLIVYLKSKFDSELTSFAQRREDAASKRDDSGSAMRQHEGMERARARMQEQLTMQALHYAERQREKEERKREEKVAEMEALLQGKSLRKKSSNLSPPASQKDSRTQQPKKPSLRPDYNPLMGDNSGGGVCYRAPRRGGGG